MVGVEAGYFRGWEVKLLGSTVFWSWDLGLTRNSMQILCMPCSGNLPNPTPLRTEASWGNSSHNSQQTNKETLLKVHVT